MFILLVAAASALFAIAGTRFAHAVGGTKHLILSTALFATALAALTMLFVRGTLTLFAVYTAAWIAAIISYSLVGGISRRTLLVANTVALCFMLASSLIHFGYLCALDMAQVEPSELQVRTGQSEYRCAATCGSLVVAILFALVFARIMHASFPNSKLADRALKPFFAFGFFANSYLLLDLIPIILNTWFDYMAYFLMGGTVILALFCAVFSGASAVLGAEALRASETLALERERKNLETRMRLYRLQASTDPLTGISTRRAGQETLERLAAQNAPFTLAFIDLDGLKRVNDECGHRAGDAFITAFTNEMRAHFDDDCLIRWGGDEFLLVSEDATEDELAAKLSTIRPIAHLKSGERPVTFSFGIATCDESVDGALKKADYAMYEAKRTSCVHKTGKQTKGVAQ